jgi:alpha-L-fucosidase
MTINGWLVQVTQFLHLLSTIWDKSMIKQASASGLQWFQDARFGMFIHWGPSALFARHDWVMYAENIHVDVYKQQAMQFNPTKFNAEEWVSIAADAGQKYIVFTTRHHDGFSMYNTALSAYKITNTPFARDPVSELANACAKRNDIKLGFYNSLLDWHHPAYHPVNADKLGWQDYVAFLHGQIRELCTNYGEVACIWFDGHWPRMKLDDSMQHFHPGGSFEYEALYNLIHELQPDAVVINNHHVQPQPGEDIQGFEQDLPGLNEMGFNTTTISTLPTEVCMTINDHWFFINGSHNHKSTCSLIHYLVRSTSAGANYLLNVGPTADGEILPIHTDRLRNIGKWLRENGESIYGTRAGLIPPDTSVVSTRKNNTHYIHILENVSDCVTLKGVPETIQRAYHLVSGHPIDMRQDNENMILTIREEYRDAFDTVIVME